MSRLLLGLLLSLPCARGSVSQAVRQIAAEIESESKIDNEPPPPWPASKLFRLNPGCTQRIMLLSMKVKIGHIFTSVPDTKFDARAWVTVYQYGHNNFNLKDYNLYDSLSPGSKGMRVGVHNDMFPIPLTYVPNGGDTKNMIGFMTRPGLRTDCNTESGRRSSVSLRASRCDEIVNDFNFYADETRKQFISRLDKLTLDPSRRAYLSNRLVSQENRGRVFNWGRAVPALFTEGQAKAHLGYYHNRLRNIGVFADGNPRVSKALTPLADLTYGVTAENEKYANRRFIADLRDDGLSKKTWKWRMQHLNYDGSIDRDSQDYTGFTGCHSGPGLNFLHGPDKDTALFTFLKFSRDKNISIVSTTFGPDNFTEFVNQSPLLLREFRRDMFCEYVCSLPSDLPAKRNFFNYWGVDPFVFIQDSPNRVVFAPKVDGTLPKQSFKVSNYIVSGRLLDDVRDWIWPSALRHSPIQGAHPNFVYAAKRFFCEVTGSFFEYENNNLRDFVFHREGSDFFSSITYRVTWASSSLPDYLQLANSCEMLFEETFQTPYTIFSPIALGKGGLPLVNKTLLSQDYFGLCDWNSAALTMRQSGGCETTSLGGFSIFFDACTRLGKKHYPVVNFASPEGWSCLYRQHQVIQDEECALSYKDRCSYFSEYRTFISGDFPYPGQYDCPFEVDDSICNGHGHVYPASEQRCRMHNGQFCICDVGYHGQFCADADIRWRIEYNTSFNPSDPFGVEEWEIYQAPTAPIHFVLVRTTANEASIKFPYTSVQLRLNASTCHDYLFGSTIMYDISLAETWRFSHTNSSVTSTTTTSTTTTSTTTTTTTPTTSTTTTEPINPMCVDVPEDSNPDYCQSYSNNIENFNNRANYDLICNGQSGFP